MYYQCVALVIYFVNSLIYILHNIKFCRLAHTPVTSRNVFSAMAYQEGESLESWLSEWWIFLNELNISEY